MAKNEYRSVWIRIAGNSQRIKNKLEPPHWRYEIEGETEQHLLLGWSLQGQATAKNNSQGTEPNAQGKEFLAWVRYFGDIVVGDTDFATITLRNPP